MSASRDPGILGDPAEIDDPRRRRPDWPAVEAHPGLGVRLDSGVDAVVVDCTESIVTVRDGRGHRRQTRNAPGAFVVDGRRVTLRPRRAPAGSNRLTASGSIAAPEGPARVARAGRLYVEGRHDAELLEKVWGDDLRDEAIVVEAMDGVDDLAELVRGFRPAPGRRLGVLVDHLVADSKESRLAAAVDHPQVLVRGHRFVDVWAAVDPHLADLEEWPDVPRGRQWKAGICDAVGVDDPAAFWRRLLGRVGSFRDLDPSLVGAVEELIDFVTADD